MTFFCRNPGREILARAVPNRILALGLGVFFIFAALAGAQTWAPPNPQPSYGVSTAPRLAAGTAAVPQPKSGVHYYPMRDPKRIPGTLNLKVVDNLIFRGGPVITSAHVVFIFWGPSFNNNLTPDYNYARTLQSFRNQFGTTPEYNTITQYGGSNGTIALTNLFAGTPDWFDSLTTPPSNVTDAIAQGEVNAYLSTHAFDANAIYEIVLPTTSYSTFLGFSSCGGPSPSYCAYHNYYTSSTNVVKYSVEPYPSCAGCQLVPGWLPEQSQEVFVTHETREAVTDPQLNTWTDSNSFEADDKCHSLTFIGTGGFSYQYEWSNAASACVASTPIGPPPPNYVGTLDHAGCDTLAGWAADSNRLNTSINVSFYDNQTLLTTVLASLSRPDVGSYLGDNGLHGFSIATPSALLDGNPHTLFVRFESSNTNLASSPASLTCSSSPPVANFSFTCTGLTCTFNGASSTGGGLTYAWSFGDSGTGTGSTINHTYGASGVYTATLTVTDSITRQSAESKNVSVTSDPVAPAENYFAVAPCRILDTRNTTILTNNTPRVVNIVGLCGIPSTAKAVSFNVTAVSPTGSGKITLYPGNLTSSWPGAKSSLNFDPATSPRSNSAVVQLATDGTGTLGINAPVSGSPGQVHLVLDVQGYFSTDTTAGLGAQGPLGFQTLPICRIADTRPSSPLVAGTVRTFTTQGVCGVPVGTTVASLNIGVPGPTYSGDIKLYPSNLATPLVTTINFQAGISNLRNGARVNLSPTTPDLAAQFTSATSGASVHAYFDVYGYFKSDAPLKYHPITPCRAVDTSTPATGGPVLVTDTVRTFQIQGNCGVPVGAKAALVRLVISSPTSGGDLTAYASNLSLPSISTAKFDANEPGLSMGTIVPLSTLADDLAVSAGQMTAGGTVGLAIDVFGYFQ
jgi:PKD repeat protein